MEEKNGNENILGKNSLADEDIKKGIWTFKYQNNGLKTKIMMIVKRYWIFNLKMKIKNQK